MPTYQYACTDCSEELEVHQSFTDDTLTVCPSCEGRLRKVFNAVGVVFKGSGFYKTDSRKAESAGSGKDSSSGADKSSDKPSDKPAEKSSGGSGSGGSGDKSGGSGTSNGGSAKSSAA